MWGLLPHPRLLLFALLREMIGMLFFSTFRFSHVWHQSFAYALDSSFSGGFPSMGGSLFEKLDCFYVNAWPTSFCGTIFIVLGIAMLDHPPLSLYITLARAFACRWGPNSLRWHFRGLLCFFIICQLASDILSHIVTLSSSIYQTFALQEQQEAQILEQSLHDRFAAIQRLL